MPQPQPLFDPVPAPPADATPVLILDDERFDRHRLARLCSGLDFQCDITNATTLSDFAAALDKGYFKLILMDYRLPDGTGLDALDMVRLSARNNAAATIMITGQGQESVAETARAAGCQDYLSKDDLSKTAFHRAVRSALAKAMGLGPEMDKEPGFGHFARQSVRDMKPMVSRMMRQVRDLRAESEAAHRGRIDGLEESAIALWEVLVELERKASEEPQPDELRRKFDKPAMFVRQASRPPSPFSRRRN